MLFRTTLLAAAIAVAVGHPAVARTNVFQTVKLPSVTFQTVDSVKDPTFNQLTAIDERGTLGGYYGSGAAGHPNTVFALSVRQPGVLYYLDVPPGIAQRQITGISTTIHPPAILSVEVGFVSTTNNGTSDTFLPAASVNGTFHTPFGLDAFSAGTTSAQFLGINPKGTAAVGIWVDGAGTTHGFLVPQQGNVVEQRLTGSGVKTLQITGVTDNMLMSGFATDAAGTFGFYKYDGTPGFRVGCDRIPDCGSVQLLAISNRSVAVGTMIDAAGFGHGFAFDLKTKAYTRIDAPDAGGKPQQTTLQGVNSTGTAVGFYVDANGNNHGLIVHGVSFTHATAAAN